jgi:hypothetical protein
MIFTINTPDDEVSKGRVISDSNIRVKPIPINVLPKVTLNHP